MGKEDFRGEPIEGTLRVQMLKQFDIHNVYTLEFNYAVNSARQVRTINYLFFKQVSDSVYGAIVEFLTDKEVFGMKSFCLTTMLQRELWDEMK